MGKSKKKIYKERVGGGSIPYGDGRINPASMVDAETGYAIGDPFAYGRKKGRIDPKLRARDSHLYGTPSTIFVGALSSIEAADNHTIAKVKMVEKLRHFRNGDIKKYEIHSKTLVGAKNIVIKAIGDYPIIYNKNGKSLVSKFEFRNRKYDVTIKSVNTGYQVTVIQESKKVYKRQILRTKPGRVSISSSTKSRIKTADNSKCDSSPKHNKKIALLHPYSVPRLKIRKRSMK